VLTKRSVRQKWGSSKSGEKDVHLDTLRLEFPRFEGSKKRHIMTCMQVTETLTLRMEG
jgi:hypothetical protein